MTLAEAKKFALATEDEIAALVPRQFVAAQEQPKGPLLSCASGKRLWSGRTTLSLQGNASPFALLAGIQDGLKKKSGYKFSTDSSVDGSPRLQITASSVGSYLVDFEKGKTWLVISSNSPCFTPPKDIYLGGLH